MSNQYRIPISYVHKACAFFSRNLEDLLKTTYKDHIGKTSFNMEEILNTAVVQNSTGNEENLMNITQDNELYSNSGSEDAAEIKRLTYVTIFPFLIIFESIGNLLTFVVMRRGSMKYVSTSI